MLNQAKYVGLEIYSHVSRNTEHEFPVVTNTPTRESCGIVRRFGCLLCGS